MKWVDSSKGICDYFFASVPLISLIFVIFAYFHTVHPRFEQHDELERTKGFLGDAESRLAVLSDKVADLQNANRKTANQKSYAEQLYFSVVDAETRFEYLINSDRLYFSKEDIITEYRKYFEQTVSEGGSMANPLSIKAIEVVVSSSQQSDLLIVDEWSCGSGGCIGPLFISINDAYCFSSWAHTQTIEQLDSLISLECGKFSNDNKVFLTDIVY
ncbi:MULTISPECIES: hypothetical protein [Vibrio]|uniref:hypothetical protein n=1 Tax=Vibrio TaxID=662 RepID=UPI0006304246|nr:MULTISPECIES: hypothetical protein [Vibrio]MCC4860412.1 hypothetical protein [Vibrio splendidus]MDH5934703.1 hypothetical protein [Vibrio splendidus]TCT55666.1 hypothetical protein EDB42_102756 [Vibrio crassostreae]TCT79897.1 hypothetical protein EDB41_102756 [Vibrio crassostreae]TCT97748.1 hypothetical protein EDB38_10212 [Vibrio crassostreae]